ncbi:MAG: hypothetical protein H7Z10_04285 [Gemmatimonadaceae bacterium]|nr:hypothetical protein [Acetobacteraceae bacterium]
MPRKKLGLYEVGYCKPPAQTRFVKGQSGNPRGASPGGRSLARSVERILNKRLSVTENGTKRNVTVIDGILMGLAQKALKGDHRTAKLLLEMQQWLPPPEQEDTKLAKERDMKIQKGLEMFTQEELEQLGTMAARVARLQGGDK